MVLTLNNNLVVVPSSVNRKRPSALPVRASLCSRTMSEAGLAALDINTSMPSVMPPCKLNKKYKLKLHYGF